MFNVALTYACAAVRLVPHTCIVGSRGALCLLVQIDLAFAEPDVVDITSPGMGFIIGRAKQNAQPQLPRLRALAKKSETFVALLQRGDQV